MFDRYRGIESASKKELVELIRHEARQPSARLMPAADALRKKAYDRKVYFRGLVEFSNHCKNGCYYCGLQNKNRSLPRYRLDAEEILHCCLDGYRYGFRSFVLQSGEDQYYNQGPLAEVVRSIKTALPDCALTLSVGELSPGMYRQLYEAGGDRFLLRHETANTDHYRILHPEPMSLAARKECLYQLKEIGFTVGAGFMVGSPGQTLEHLAEDLIFLRELQPHMVGIGPFIPQVQTPFAGHKAGSLQLTLTMLALVRLLLPRAMLPSTTALGTLQDDGRELGLKAGANVVMPNLTPLFYRDNYTLYDGKVGIDSGIGKGLTGMLDKVKATGYAPDFSRGDHVDYQPRMEGVI